MLLAPSFDKDGYPDFYLILSECFWGFIKYRIGRVLSQVINLQTQTNFSDWINDFRIAAAKQKISSAECRDQKIAAIAFGSGFNTLSSFNAVFKNKTGYTPTGYRNFYVDKNLN